MTFAIVGGNVTTGTGDTTISAEVIPKIFTFTATGDVYDPTVQNSSCGETQTALSGMLNGPELKSRRWYVGRTVRRQRRVHGRADARGVLVLHQPEWCLSELEPGPSGNGTNGFDVSVASSVGTEVDTGTCNVMGEIDYNSWDSFLQGTSSLTRLRTTASAQPRFRSSCSRTW